MAFSDIQRSAGDLFGGLKDKVKSATGRSRDDAYDDFDDGYDDYGDEEFSDDYGEYGYDENAAYHEFDAAADTGRLGDQSTYSTTPSLVSYDDVRASASRSYADEDRFSVSTRTGGRAKNHFSRSTYSTDAAEFKPFDRYEDYVSAYQRKDADKASTAASSSAPDYDYDPDLTPAGPVTERIPVAAAEPAAKGSGYDPYAAYQGTGALSHNPTRKLRVIKPAGYDEVESVARILKSGDVVVLSLRQTSHSLSKRVLDFSFGVASALDASVECIADKVFIINRGKGLSDAEISDLRTQGVY